MFFSGAKWVHYLWESKWDEFFECNYWSNSGPKITFLPTSWFPRFVHMLCL